MKTFFTKNKRLVEIVLALLLVFVTAGYYYLIYIPAREDQIIERRFRTLRRIEKNMQEKLAGYLATIKNCIVRGDEDFFKEVVDNYNSDPEKLKISISKKERISKQTKPGDFYDSLVATLNHNENYYNKFVPSSNGKKITIVSNWYKLTGDSVIHHVVLESVIDYKEFVIPLLRKSVFDQYLVFNVNGGDSSSMIYEDFNSGISFNNIDSLFDAKEKVYTSRIVRIETGGEKYLAFLHPCGYTRKNDRIIVGLLKLEMFNREKQQLPEQMVTSILLIALFTFLLLPVIRLSLMGKKERIRLSDVYANYFAFSLLIPVLILVLFWNNQRFIANTSNKHVSKTILANQISQSFLNELNAAYALLNKMDSLHANDKTLDTLNIRYLSRYDGVPAEIHDLSIKNVDSAKALAAKRMEATLAKDSIYPNTEYVFWMNAENGMEKANWSFGEDPPRGKYNGRQYFIKASNNNLTSIDGRGLNNVAIEPIVSRIDGKFKLVLAKRSINRKYIVASPSTFTSVINPVLPIGYEFSITDATGNTIFDSDTSHNLNENLLEEFTNEGPLKATFDAGISRVFKTRYQDEDFSVLAQPIPNLPYFIVISENESFGSSLYTQCFSFTMVMMFSFFLFLFVEFIILLSCYLNNTKLQKNIVDLSWINPRESWSYKYFFLFAFNIAIFLLLAVFCFTGFSIQRITEYVFLFAIAASLSTIATIVYRKEPSGKTISLPTDKKDKLAAASMMALTVVLVLISLFYSYLIFARLLFFIAISICLFILISNYIPKAEFKNYRVNFHRMIFSKILLSSGIPVIIFYMCIYNFEQRLEERLKLFDYAKKIEQHTKDGKDVSDAISQIKKPNGIKRFYTDGVWICKVNDSVAAINDKPYNDLDSTNINLLKTSRIRYNEVSGITENFELIKPFGSDQFSFNNILEGSESTLNYTINKMSGTHADKKFISLSASGLILWKTPWGSQEGHIFILSLVISLIFCFLLLKYVVIRIFGKIVPATTDFELINTNVISGKNVQFLYVQGIPGGNKTALIRKFLSIDQQVIFYSKDTAKNGFNTVIIDFGMIPAKDEMPGEKEAYERNKSTLEFDDNWYAKLAAISGKKVNCVVFNHFEYNMLNDYANRIKLELLEKFVYLGDRKIVIVSGINASEFINRIKPKSSFLQASANAKNDIKKTAKDTFGTDETNGTSFDYISRWNNLLGKFGNVYINNNCPEETPGSNGTINNAFFHAELNFPILLNKFRESFRLPVENGKTEENILMIQSLSEQYYGQIWDSLTHEEQLILYDLAEDGLINTSSYMPLSKLMNKGLIKKNDGVLIMMNRSFRNYILTSVNPTEISSIEKEINEGQTWEDYKYPVLIVLAALVYFVLSSNPEKFGNILPVVSGIMAGIPTILKLFSYMKPSEAKS